jgi:ubiquinone/menaquinone biosynthesis C-methylase UbiE
MLEHLHGGKNTSQPGGSMQGWGHTYDHLTKFLFGGREQQIRQETIQRAQIHAGDRVLEVGCGTGTLTLAAKRAAGPEGEVFGVDVAEDMLETGRKKSAKADLPVTFQTASIENLPFPSGSFDVLLSSLMLHHIHGGDAKRRGLKEVFRVLKPGGTLMIAEFRPPKSGPMRWLFRMGLSPAMAEDTRLEIIQILQETGFTIQPVPEGFRYLTYIKGLK